MKLVGVGDKSMMIAKGRRYAYLRCVELILADDLDWSRYDKMPREKQVKHNILATFLRVVVSTALYTLEKAPLRPIQSDDALWKSPKAIRTRPFSEAGHSSQGLCR